MPNLIELKDAPKAYTLDQDKAREPGQTVALVRRRLAESGLDLLERTERIDNGRLGIPVYISRLGAHARRFMPTTKQMGKGATPAQAEASAVMEMVERFSFFHFAAQEANFTTAPMEAVEDALPLAHLAASVHHPADDLARAAKCLKGLPLKWTRATRLDEGRDYSLPFDWFYEINEFNGPAAGNTLEEALAQALCELFERHVSALTAREKPILPLIDLDGIGDPVASELVAKFRAAGVELIVKDISMGLGAPTIAALGHDPATFPALSELVFTAGTAPSPVKAFIRALTEVAQLAGDFNTRANFVASGLPKYATLEEAAYLRAASPVVQLASLPDISAPNMKTEVERLVAAAAQKGLPTYALDTTHPELGVPAVYAIMPGAHFRERAANASIPMFAAKLATRLETPPAASRRLAMIKELYPGAYWPDFFQAQLMIEAGRPDQALAHLKAALALDPHPQDLPGVLTYAGLALKEMERYEEAIGLLARSAALDPERRDTFNLLGFCHFKTGRHEEAIRAFESVLRLDPGSGIDHANIAANHEKLGRVREAAAFYRLALRLDPSLGWAREKLASLGG